MASHVQDPTQPGGDLAPAGPPVLGRIASWLAAAGTLWIFALMALIVADVLGRNFFDSPITGVAEIAARSVVAIVFLQIAAAVLAGRMTQADFLVIFLGSYSPGLVRVLETLFALVGAVVFAAIVWASWPDTADAWRTGEFFGVQGLFTIPTLPFRVINVVGASLACVAYLVVALQVARSPGSRHLPPKGTS
ncbi:TRAP transporter small permease subunit [Aurantimonas endophytica]|uniref:TRAP transporter small permease protein n=1 Tax=Aurantimonas endophytica TaxID=1522175 RepID=A0A7W6HGH4_9HYPH|nr:TRAP transporter small permease [Aurantimonas endophytica]MBB4004810.1 TRAP-type C4-dicarboxylate transport system permease small subunit [Aurantimonas endophytica]MCO6405620.1 TRAP transporter small permease subunit [Aurantimonas endophytica]